jgi:4-amino-4-deoxy-L-arabinose transferase-like glycosyltransferase
MKNFARLAAVAGFPYLAAVAGRRPRIFLVCLCLALWLPGLFVLPPTDRDESRFALATRQMVETGDYVRIMNGAEPRSKKPIGIHWLQAPFVLAARAAGVATDNPIWPYRIASLLGGLLAVVATEAIGRTLLASRRAGLLAGAMLGASVILTVETHLAKTDAALLGATTLAMAVLARAWSGLPVVRARAAIFWIALGAGILIKGPITPMVVGLAAAGASLAGGRVAWLGCLRPAWGVPLLAAVVLPWFIAIGIDTHGAFFAQAVGGDLGQKLAGGAESHGALPGLHLLLLPFLTFPSTMPILLGLAAAVAHRREPATLFLLAWLLPAWLVFEAVPTKLPHYTLPLYPALFLLAASFLETRGAALSTVLRLVRPWAMGLLGMASVGLAGAALAVPIILHAPPWLGVPAALLTVPVAWLAFRSRPLVAAACAVPLYAALLQWEVPRLDAVWISPRALASLRAAWPGVPADGADVFAVGYAEPSLMFLAGPRIHWLPTGALAARAWSRLPHAAAFIAAPELASFEAGAGHAGIAAKPAARIDGIDYARGKGVELELFVR